MQEFENRGNYKKLQYARTYINFMDGFCSQQKIFVALPLDRVLVKFFINQDSGNSYCLFHTASSFSKKTKIRGDYLIEATSRQYLNCF